MSNTKSCESCGGAGIGGTNEALCSVSEGAGGDYKGMRICQACGGCGTVSDSEDSDQESAQSIVFAEAGRTTTL